MQIENIKQKCIRVFENDYNKLQELETSKLYFSEEVSKKHISFIPASMQDLLDSIENIGDLAGLFTISTSNKKLNKEDKISSISYGPYYLCPNLLNNTCRNCNICYGAKNERFKNIVKSRLKNYIFFNAAAELKKQDEKEYQALIKTAVKLQKKNITDIMRISQQSDIPNNQILEVLKDIISEIETYRSIKAYGYSKTKNLDYESLADNIIFNQSVSLKTSIEELEKIQTSNTFITVSKELNEQLQDTGKIKNYYLCQNNCSKCKNCISTNNKPTLCIKH